VSSSKGQLLATYTNNQIQILTTTNSPTVNWDKTIAGGAVLADINSDGSKIIVYNGSHFFVYINLANTPQTIS
jgi:hypothetical protein